MTEAILNQAWEDVADDVTSAIERAVEPLLKKAVDGIYGGLLEATQDYLKDNLAFNIASRISAAEREASAARQRADLYKAERDLFQALALQAIGTVADAERETNWGSPTFGPTPSEELRAKYDKHSNDIA